jgi:hypothetical protein
MIGKHYPSTQKQETPKQHEQVSRKNTDSKFRIPVLKPARTKNGRLNRASKQKALLRY